MTAPAEHDIAVLAGRLNVGWVICAEEPDPARRRRLEDHWLRLLHDYETACDRADPGPESPCMGVPLLHGGSTPPAKRSI